MGGEVGVRAENLLEDGLLLRVLGRIGRQNRVLAQRTYKWRTVLQLRRPVG